MTVFTKEWTDWIDHNVNAGCDKDGVFKILLDEGYSFEQIKNQMNYSPTVNMSHALNPHRRSENLERAQDSPEILYLSNAVRLETDKAEFYVIDNFLNQKECDQMIKLIGDMKRPSLMVNHGDKENNFRTSSTCDLGQLDSPFIKEIDERICKMMGIDSSYSEPIQGQFYEIGQEFKAHTDYFEEDEIEECDGGKGQRTYTFFINLNDVEEGGTTHFPALELEHTPKRGTAVIWNNLRANGKGNYNSLHHGKPVLKGNKSVITKWFRSKGFGSMMIKTPHEKIPNFTSVGFEKTRLPDEILKAIKRFYQDNITDQKAEFVEGGYIQGKNKSCAPSSLLDLPPYLKKEIHDYLKPILEKWSGTALEPTFIYGIRTYHDGAVLKAHRDRKETHIISCIINVFQDVREDWALQIDDHFYRKHEVFMKEGEMVFYEGAKLMHGREVPFEGNSFANIFCHFTPVDYVPPRE